MRAALLLALLAGCGARTGLEAIPPVPPPPPCEPHEEICNAMDDDCDGDTDEALGFGPIAGPFEVVNDMHGYFTDDLVAVEGGYVSVWNVGFDGSHPPHTNAFARLLDRDGRGAGEAHPILERPVTTGLTAAPSPRGIVLTYCGRFGADDHAATSFLDGRGNPLGGEVTRGDGARSCGAVVQAGIWSGTAHLFSWITNGGVTDGTYPVFLDVADVNGNELGERQAELHGDLYTAPTFAVSGARVALAYGARPEIRRSAIDVALLASDGTALGAPVRVGQAADGHAFGNAHVVADPTGGWVVFASDPNGTGLFAARLTASGELTSALTEIEHSARRFDALDAAARPGGGFVVIANASAGPDGTFYAATIDPTLNVTATWEPGDALAYLFAPSLDAATGRIFVQGADPDSTRLVIRELGCAR